MPLLSLIGRLGLDTSNFEQGLSKSETAAQQFGNKFRRSIVGTVGSFFTLGYAINAVRDKIREFNADTTGEPIRLAKEDVADILAQRDRIEVMEEELKIRKEVAKINDEIFKLADQRFLKELSNEDRLIELTQRRNGLLEILKRNQLGPVKAAELRLEAEKLLGTISSIDVKDEKNQAPAFRRANMADRINDPLARIGGFTGGADVKVITVLESIKNSNEEIADNTAGNSVRLR